MKGPVFEWYVRAREQPRAQCRTKYTVARAKNKRRP